MITPVGGWEDLKGLSPSPQGIHSWELEWSLATSLPMVPAPSSYLATFLSLPRAGPSRQGAPLTFLSREGGGNLWPSLLGASRRRWIPGLEATSWCCGTARASSGLPDARVLGRGPGFNWRLARIVFWQEDSTDEYTSYFGRKSHNPLTVKILCWWSMYCLIPKSPEKILEGRFGDERE